MGMNRRYNLIDTNDRVEYAGLYVRVTDTYVMGGEFVCDLRTATGTQTWVAVPTADVVFIDRAPLCR